jgi:hypothetical protein
MHVTLFRVQHSRVAPVCLCSRLQAAGTYVRVQTKHTHRPATSTHIHHRQSPLPHASPTERNASIAIGGVWVLVDRKARPVRALFSPRPTNYHRAGGHAARRKDRELPFLPDQGNQSRGRTQAGAQGQGRYTHVHVRRRSFELRDGIKRHTGKLHIAMSLHAHRKLFFFSKKRKRNPTFCIFY